MRYNLREHGDTLTVVAPPSQVAEKVVASGRACSSVTPLSPTGWSHQWALLGKGQALARVESGEHG